MWHIWRLGIGLISAAIIASIAVSAGLPLPMSRVAGLAFLMIFWWLDGSVSSGVTGLLPLVFLPIMGITKASEICESYFSDGIVICFGSLIMANAIEEHNLHEYFAHKMIRVTSSMGRRGILLGFIIVTGVLSMWLSNTATAALMVPLSKAVFSKLRDKSTTTNNDDDKTAPSTSPICDPAVFDNDQNYDNHKPTACTIVNGDDDIYDINLFAAATDLSIAYAATLGGMATITGTGANIALVGIMQVTFGDERGSISFLNWLIIFTPLTILNLAILFGVLYIIIKFYPYLLSEKSSLNTTIDDNRHISNSTLLTNKKESATLSYKEYCVLSSFVLMTTLWMTRDPPGNWGWSLLLPEPDFISDGTVAMACSLLLFIIPKSPTPFYTAFRKLKLKCQMSNYLPLTDSSSHHSTSLSSHSVAVELNHISETNAACTTSEEEFNSVISLSSEEIKKSTSSSPNRRMELKLNNIEQIERSQYNSDLIKDNLQRHNKSKSEIGEDNADEEAESVAAGGILSWKIIAKMNWDIIFLLGGGFALSRGFQDSGLSSWLTAKLLSGETSFIYILLVSSIISCSLTNVMSNVAVANIVLPAIACVAPSMDKQPLLLLAPVTLCISLALLFPIGTPPNAIIMTNRSVTVKSMGIIGAICTSLFLTTILLYNYLATPHILHYLDRKSEKYMIHYIDICNEKREH